MDDTKKDDGTLPPATEQEILLDGEKIAGYVIKPWTIRKCAEISPILEKILKELKKRRLTFRDFVILEKDAEGKDKVTVKFAAHPGNLAGGVYGVRILRSETKP